MQWWYWMIWKAAYPGGPEEFVGAGAYQMTTYDAFMTEFRTRAEYLTDQIYRWVWNPQLGIWVYDDRTERELLAAS